MFNNNLKRIIGLDFRIQINLRLKKKMKISQYKREIDPKRTKKLVFKNKVKIWTLNITKNSKKVL